MMKKLMFAALALAMLSPVVTGQAADLAHRWSFNGNLMDSAGGKDAAIVDLGANDATFSSTQVTLAGGGKDTSDYIDLPDGVVSSLGDSVTMEIWTTQNTIQNWSRIWDFGSSTSHNVFMSWSRGTAPTQDRVSWAGPSDSQTVDDSVAPYTLGTEFHIVCVFEPGLVTWYAAPADVADLGAARGSFETANLLSGLDDTNCWVGRSQWPDNTAGASYNELRFWVGALTMEELEVLHDLGPERLNANVAFSPVPANGAADALPDGVLSWMPGQEAETHDVYFGTTMDALELVSPGQAGTTYDAGDLAFDATYYWRVDEIAADTIFAGDLWSFTVEPFSYVLSNVTATASSSNDETMGPEKTIDGSGLDESGQHSTTEADMWLSSLTGEQPTWIEYTFDNTYKLDKMLVWNSNQGLESVVGYGARDVKVEYSADGTSWETLGDFEFAQAPGEPTYTANTTVDFAGAAVKAVKLTINNNWGDALPQYGLSEVRFFHIPVRPTNLSPASGTTDLESPVVLSWRAGREAATYDIYLGTDENNLPLLTSVTESSYEATVEPDLTYYWQVVAVNEAADPPAWESDLMNFTTTALPRDPGTDNLTHQYTFEDGTANDSVGEAHGTLMGDAAVVDGSLVTDGVDDWMEMDGAAIAINTYTTGLTLELWSTQGPENQGFSMTASFGGTWGNGFGQDYLAFATTRGDEVSRAEFANTPDQDAPWEDEVGVNGPELNDGLVHQYILTVDDPAADGSGELAYYIDGVLQGTAPLNGTTISGLSNDFVYLGKGVYSVDGEVACKIHKFSIYNKALSLGEVRYLAAMTPKDPGTGNLTHQYTFEDGTANDSVGEAHGTLMGDAAVVDGSLVTDGVDDWMEMDGAAIAINTYTTGLTLELWSTQGPENQGFSMTASFGGTWGNGFGQDYLAFATTRGDEVSRAEFANTPDQDAPWEDEVGVNGPELNDGLVHQYILTVDDPAADGSGELAYYIDGVLQGTAPLNGTTISGLSNDFVYLGKGVYSVDGEVACKIHKFSIYNKALSLGEVRYLAGDR